MSFRKFHAVAIALIASAAFVSQARADDLYVGTPYGPSITLTGTSVGTISGQGGDFQNSTLNGSPLPWVFCVDVLNHVNPPQNFPSASVSLTGVVNGSLVNNANEIAYVLLNDVGSNPVTNQGAVQAAIWKLEYGGTITGIGANGTITQANGYVTAAQAYTGPSLISQLSWLTLQPGPSYAQGLVTITPEPSSFAIAGLAGLGMLLYARKRRSR